MAVGLRFENGSADTMSPDYGPYAWIQVTYGWMRGCLMDETSEQDLGYQDSHHRWVDKQDGKVYTDVVIYQHEEE